MPDPITIGHGLMLLALLAALWGVWQLVHWARNRGHIYGTPQYARARDGRRFAVWSFAVAILLFLIGCFTPLADMAIA